MPTNTPRLQLIKPAGSENVLVADITNSFDILDANPGSFICTSTTRPSSPFEGQVIYETNTKLLRVRSGADWAVLAYADSSSSTTKPYRIMTRTVDDAVPGDNTFEIITWAPGVGDPGVNSTISGGSGGDGGMFTLPGPGIYRVDLNAVWRTNTSTATSVTLSLFLASSARISTITRIPSSSTDMPHSLSLSGIFTITGSSADASIRCRSNAAAGVIDGSSFLSNPYLTIEQIKAF